MADDDSGRTGPVTLHGTRDDAHANWRLSVRALPDVSISSGLILPPQHTLTFSVIIHSRRCSVRMNETVSALMTGAVTAPVCHGEGLTDVVGWIWVIPMIIICLVEGKKEQGQGREKTLWLIVSYCCPDCCPLPTLQLMTVWWKGDSTCNITSQPLHL